MYGKNFATTCRFNLCYDNLFTNHLLENPSIVTKKTSNLILYTTAIQVGTNPRDVLAWKAFTGEGIYKWVSKLAVTSPAFLSNKRICYKGRYMSGVFRLFLIYTPTIKGRRSRNAGHCWTHKDEFERKIIVWQPKHGISSVGRPVKTFIKQLEKDTGLNKEDLPTAMLDRKHWKKRVNDIRASSTRWDDDDTNSDKTKYVCVCAR